MQVTHHGTAEAILKLLYDHIDKSADCQARVRWQPNTVVLWDNRVTAHVSFTVVLWVKERMTDGLFRSLL